MTKCKFKDDLIQNPENLRRHVVLLGAGASLASFPAGEKNGKKLPIMSNFVETLGLEQDLKDHGIDPTGNFEDIYASIADEAIKKHLENKIFTY